MQFNYLPDWVIAAQTAAVSISKITRVGPTATATVASTAALSTGQYVTIYGPSSPNTPAALRSRSPAARPSPIRSLARRSPRRPCAVTYTVGTGYCRGGNNATACAANNANYSTTFQSPPFYAADFNRLAYNPDVNYTAAAQGRRHAADPHDRHRHRRQRQPGFFANVQTDPFTAALRDVVSLVPAVAVPLYCNTDWPITAGVNLALNRTSATRTANTRPAPAAGAGSTAPSTTPRSLRARPQSPTITTIRIRSSNGATGTQYFYKQLGNKILYCDTSSPYWPRIRPSSRAARGRHAGLRRAPRHKQTCNVELAKTCNPVIGSRTWTLHVPAACMANPRSIALPGPAGPTATRSGTGAAPECLACTCKADYQPLPASRNAASPAPRARPSAACWAATWPNARTVGRRPDTGCSAGAFPITRIPRPYAPAATAPRRRSCGTRSPMRVSATTTLQDSNAQGFVCRHNNQIYAVSGARRRHAVHLPADQRQRRLRRQQDGRPRYRSRRPAPSPQAVTSGCPTIGTTINIPRHYYTIDSVQFCDNIDTTVNGQWRASAPACARRTNDLHAVPERQVRPVPRASASSTTAAPTTVHGPGDAAAGVVAQLRAGDHQLRELVRRTTGCARTPRRPRPSLLQPAGQHVSRRLPHPRQEPTPIGTGHAIIWVDVKRFQPRRRGTLVDTRCSRSPRSPTQDADDLRDAADRQPVRDRRRRRAAIANVNPLPAGAKDPFDKDSSGNVDQLPEQLPHPVHRRLHEPDRAADGRRRPGRRDPAGDGRPRAVADGSRSGQRAARPSQLAAAWPTPFKWGTTAVPDTLADVALYYWARDLRARR